MGKPARIALVLLWTALLLSGCTKQNAQDTTLNFSDGENGVVLFVVEQLADFTIPGRCTPEVRVEFGKGMIAPDSIE